MATQTRQVQQIVYQIKSLLPYESNCEKYLDTKITPHYGEVSRDELLSNPGFITLERFNELRDRRKEYDENVQAQRLMESPTFLNRLCWKLEDYLHRNYLRPGRKCIVDLNDLDLFLEEGEYLISVGDTYGRWIECVTSFGNRIAICGGSVRWTLEKRDPHSYCGTGTKSTTRLTDRLIDLVKSQNHDHNLSLIVSLTTQIKSINQVSPPPYDKMVI